ncbi:cytochrome c biogenesis CcdA family protein [Fuchsiella alkaliacetigena]|uniref:cytochrome c biogenesis CcdA family protein n=1 Tax=Fuchsiella alkaliacetigena TaxID=957042 RepID=UPI00200A1C12|nr:cytochrome c biogenesis protein CcdA [Fuchsiella alkaliacetigena]MCK8824112.1 cytochrome c biogenesis protein CcdA [Fuchsiella alkaliacetigena]
MFGEEVTILIAFGAGLASFMTPCVLPLIPTYVTYLSGASIEEVKGERALNRVKKKLYLNSVMFILGFSLVFVVLGMSATLIGQIVLRNQNLIRRIGGIVIIIFGLHLTGLIKLPFLYRGKQVDYQPKERTAISSFLLGMFFSVGWNPCSGPILSSILIYAGSAQTIWTGGGLLAVYSLGLAIPFLIVTLFIGYLFTHLKKLNKHLNKISIISGILLIIMGVLVYTNMLQSLMNIAY